MCMLHAAVRPVGGGLGRIHTKSHVCYSTIAGKWRVLCMCGLLL